MSNNPANNSDLLLIADYQKTRDLSLVGRLYKQYMHLVYGLCLKYLKNREDSQDAVMHIFEQLTEKLKHSEVSNFKSWLYVLSKNHCLMILRSASYKNRSHAENITQTGVESELLLHHEDDKLEEDLTRLELCIEELQAEQRDCVRLFYLDKKSYKEIEAQTTYTLKNVKSYIQNGKRNLKNCMERHE